MASYVLETDELAGLVGFLNAKKLVGLDEGLFASFTEENLPRLVEKLKQHGWLKEADRPSAHHFNDALMQTLAVAVAPHFAVLVRSKSQGRSVVFYLADKEMVQVLITEQQAIVTNIKDLDQLAEQAVLFLNHAWPGEVGIARVKGEGFDAGRRMQAATPVSATDVAAFLRGAMVELSGKA